MIAVCLSFPRNMGVMELTCPIREGKSTNVCEAQGGAWRWVSSQPGVGHCWGLGTGMGELGTQTWGE